MEDLDILKQISIILKKIRKKKNLTIIDVYNATHIPVRRIKQIESFDQKFYQDRKLLFIRYCKIYQDFLEINDDENFDRISENYIKDEDDIIKDLEQSIRPSASNLEIAIVFSLVIWGIISFMLSQQDKMSFKQLAKDKLIYFENIN
jgi:cytoskeletal protein RodZ